MPDGDLLKSSHKLVFGWSPGFHPPLRPTWFRPLRPGRVGGIPQATMTGPDPLSRRQQHT